MAYPAVDPVVRFWKKVDASDAGGCWMWTGGKQSRGRYGAFTLAGGKQVGAHRFAYELANGPVPDGMQVDHLCRETLCVRPDHLEAVEPSENVTRSTLGIKESSKTHCAQGHPYDEANTIVRPDGSRKCRECQRIRSSEKYYRNPEKQMAYNRARRARLRDQAKQDL